MSAADLFPERHIEEESKNAPLADRMRPLRFDELVGQEELVGKDKPLRKLIEQNKLPSVILWGPPGSGKTTLANIIAKTTESNYIPLSAVSSSLQDVRKVIEEAKRTRWVEKRGTILFVDEIHRFNKAQQDAFLPHVERGTIILIGATTENPSFEVISPLLSRCRVFVLNRLSENDIKAILLRAVKDTERGLGALNVSLSEEALKFLINVADGDARAALNLLEMTSLSVKEGQGRRFIEETSVREVAQKKTLYHDRQYEWHYNIISALHKSIRGSDVDASLYYLARMLEAGDDPLYIARRLVRTASEDIGLADPNALTIALNAYTACHYLGMPECDLALAEAVIYLATAPKSNSTYTAYMKVKKTVNESGALPVPLVICNAPTKLMKEFGYGKDYNYPHDNEEHFVAEEYLPEELKGKKFYYPCKFGFEKEISKRQQYWQKLKEKLKKDTQR
ncbi:MAG: replication-associated recombination protein A [Planctomycetota bacterium]